MIIIPIGLCIGLCREATRDTDEGNRRQQTRRQQTRVITRRVVQPRRRQGSVPQTGIAQGGSNTKTEYWSGHFSDDKGTMFLMEASIAFDLQGGQFIGCGRENGFDFTIEDGWIRANGIISFNKVVAGHKATYTGKLDGNEMKGMWYINGYDQTGGQFLLTKKGACE